MKWRVCNRCFDGLENLQVKRKVATHVRRLPSSIVPGESGDIRHHGELHRRPDPSDHGQKVQHQKHVRDCSR